MLKQILLHNTTKYPVVYTACGDAERMEIFRKLGEKFGIMVKGKWDYITEEDREYAEDLAFDQVALLDYLVLRHSQFFWGTKLSSFSYAIAFWRHVAQFGDFQFTNSDFQHHLDGQESFDNTFW
jgi:hypothetical protein